MAGVVVRLAEESQRVNKTEREKETERRRREEDAGL